MAKNAYQQKIEAQQAAYKKAREKGDVAGMRKANNAANAVREYYGKKTVNSSAGDAQFIAGKTQKQKMDSLVKNKPAGQVIQEAVAKNQPVKMSPPAVRKNQTSHAVNYKEKPKSKAMVATGMKGAIEDHSYPKAVLGFSDGLLPSAIFSERDITKQYGQKTTDILNQSKAYGGGKLGGQLVRDGMLYSAGAGLVNKGLSGLPAYQNLGKVGQAAVRIGAVNATVGAPYSAYYNYQDGKRGKDLATSTAKDTAMYAAFDGVLEAVPYAYRGIKGAVSKSGKIPMVGANGQVRYVDDIVTSAKTSEPFHVKDSASVNKFKQMDGIKKEDMQMLNMRHRPQPTSETPVAKSSNLNVAQNNSAVNHLNKDGNFRVKDSASVNKFNQTAAAKADGRNSRLTENDVQEYLSTGNKEKVIRAKNKMTSAGDKLVLTNETEIRQFVNDSIRGDVRNVTKGYGKIGDRLAKEIYEKTGGKVDISGKFLELNADNIKHSFNNHMTPKRAGDIPLRKSDYENITNIIDDFDEVLEVVSTKNGVRIKLGKVINGHSIVTEMVSESRNSIVFNNMWGVSTEKYLLDQQKRNLQYLATSKAKRPDVSFQSADEVSSNLNVAQNNSHVKNQSDPARDISQNVINENPSATRQKGGSGTESTAQGKTRKTKEQAYQDRAERNFERKMQDVLGVNKYMDRGVVKQEIKSTMEKLKSGTLSDGDIQKTFDTLFDQGMITSDQFFKEYKGLKDDIRNTTLRITDDEIKNIPDFARFRNSAFGKVKMSKEAGQSIGGTYTRLMETYPELFKEVNTTAEQLENIVDVAKSIKKSEDTLSHLYAGNAEELRGFARVEFEKELNTLRVEVKTISNYENSMRAAEKKKGAEISVEEATRMSQEAKKLQRQVDYLDRNTLLTKQEKVSVDRMLKGEITADQIPIGQNRKSVSQMYEAKKAVADMKEPLKELRAAARNQTRELAKNTLEEVGALKDKSRGFWFDREMPERNMFDVAGKENGKKLTQTYIDPVHQNEALSNVMKNEKRNQIRALNIGTKPIFDTRKLGANIPNLDGKISESTLVQLLGEKKIDIESIRAVGANPRKIQGAVDEMRVIYNDLIEQANHTLVKNGYEAIEYRKDYFPHFQMEKPDTVMEKIAATLGMEIRKDELPTDIAGLTHTFKPGKKWFSPALSRSKDETVYNALQGFDMYIEGASDIIYHTDDIQRLRALETELRYKYSDQGVKDAIDDIMKSGDTEIGKQLRVDELYAQSRSEMSEFTQWIRRYTDGLAGKKSIHDRGVESRIGREVYSISKALENRVAANMVAVNPGSWLTNFIPLTQSGELKTGEILKGMKDTVTNYVKSDGFAARSDFLTNRQGSDAIYKTMIQNAADKASSPMRWIDQFTTEAMTRAKYSREISKGASASEAMDAANKFTASVVADRSKGALPTLFDEKNPVTKVFTMFQVEVNNQLSYLFKDLPRNMQEEGKQKLAAALAKMAVGAYIYNDVYEKTTGRRSALDPLGIINEFSGNATGYKLKNTVDIGMDAAHGKFGIIENQKKKGLVSATAGATVDTVGNIPFVGGLMGGGRVPVSSAIPDMGKLGMDAVGLISGETNKRKALYDLKKEAMKPAAYMIPPFGGGQAKKILETTGAMIRGGDFKVNAEGKDQLQFAVKPSLGNAVKGSLFGKYSLPGAQRFIDEGALSDKKTEMYKQLVKMGVNHNQTEGFIRELPKKIEDKRNYIMDSSLTVGQKNKAGEFISEKKIDYSNRTEFEITQYAEGTQKKIRKVIAAGVSAEDAMGAYEKQKKYATTVGKAFALQEYDEKIQEQYNVTNSARLKMQLLQRQQISEKEYKKAYKAIKGVEGIKTPSGKELPASRDRKQKQIIDQLYPNYTRIQKIAIYNALGISTKVW